MTGGYRHGQEGDRHGRGGDVHGQGGDRHDQGCDGHGQIGVGRLKVSQILFPEAYHAYAS